MGWDNSYINNHECSSYCVCNLNLWAKELCSEIYEPQNHFMPLVEYRLYCNLRRFALGPAALEKNQLARNATSDLTST